MPTPVDALGESCLIWRLGDGPTMEAVAAVQRAYREVIAARQSGRLPIQDVVPAYDTLAVYFDPLKTDPAGLKNQINDLIKAAPTASSKQQTDDQPVRLTVAYNGEDLARVAAFHNLTVEQVIQRHTAPIYTVAAIGFLPHFPYLLGLDPSLITPRLPTPRPRVPAGSVGIGNDQTGVYPQVSPGGWNLLGQTDPAALTQLKPGDMVLFQEAGA